MVSGPWSDLSEPAAKSMFVTWPIVSGSTAVTKSDPPVTRT
jgi:hypothetical protein